MILYKNVDACDLTSILDKGILSLDASGNNNWDDRRRANNRTDVVYLFNPIRNNAFPMYGIALLEVEVEDAFQNDMFWNDVHKSDYVEYIVESVKPEQIKSIHIPEIFRKQLESQLSNINIDWCGISASIYVDGEFIPATEEDLTQFQQTADVWDTGKWMYFRGIDHNGEVVDLYDVNYVM